MTHQEAVDRANRVYNSSIREGLGVSEAFGAAFLDIERETAEKCHEIAWDERVNVEETGDMTDHVYNQACEDIRRTIRAAFHLEDCDAGAVEPTSPSVEGRA